MSKNVKTVQEELRRDKPKDIHTWIREQKGQPSDIHEFVKMQKQAEKIEMEKNKNEQEIKPN